MSRFTASLRKSAGLFLVCITPALLSACVDNNSVDSLSGSGIALSDIASGVTAGVKDYAADMLSAGELLQNEVERRKNAVTDGIDSIIEGKELIQEGLGLSNEDDSSGQNGE